MPQEKESVRAQSGEVSALAESLESTRSQLETAEHQLRDLAEECDAKVGGGRLLVTVGFVAFRCRVSVNSI